MRAFSCRVKIHWHQEKENFLKKLKGKLKGCGPACTGSILSGQNAKSQSPWHSTYEGEKAFLHNEESKVILGLVVSRVVLTMSESPPSPVNIAVALINGGEVIVFFVGVVRPTQLPTTNQQLVDCVHKAVLRYGNCKGTMVVQSAPTGTLQEHRTDSYASSQWALKRNSG